MNRTARNGPVQRTSSADALLNATAELLGESSAMNVSLSEISKRSAVNAAMIKYHFGNKEGLLLALLERDAEAAIVGMKTLLELDLSADQKLRIHIAAIIDAYDRLPYINRLIHFMVEAGSEHSRARVDQLFIAPMIRFYRAIVAQGVEEGTLRAIDPGLLYYSLVGATDHIFHASYSLRTTLGVDRIDATIKRRYSDHMIAIYLAGLVA